MQPSEDTVCANPEHAARPVFAPPPAVTRDNAAAVADALDGLSTPVVLDPVAVAKGGARLLAEDAVGALTARLPPRAAVVTPNLLEAAALLGPPVAATRAAMAEQARALVALGAHAALVKGGHLADPASPDALATTKGVVWLESARTATADTHGAGCTLSAALAAELARGALLAEATAAAKAYVAGAIATADRLTVGGGHGPTHHFHAFWSASRTCPSTARWSTSPAPAAASAPPSRRLRAGGRRVDARGRSHTLRENYRTSHQIRARADRRLPRAAAALDAAGVPHSAITADADRPRGRAARAAMHIAKGMEFRAVAVMACDEDLLPLAARIEVVADESDLDEVYATERHLLYDACTRARDHLLVTGVDPVSEFVDDLRS
jgi:hydroxymethylpyrimidine kinase/phosphomethylpyrimidine kinase